jgi:hypothetical protein
MAALLCNPIVWRGMFGLDACPFRYAILANAAGSRSLATLDLAQSHDSPFLQGHAQPQGAIAKVRAARPALPVSRDHVASLHLIGAQDFFHKSESQRLSQTFEESLCHTHPCGHELARGLLRDGRIHEVLADFFDRFDAKRPLLLPPQPAEPAEFGVGELFKSSLDLFEQHKLDHGEMRYERRRALARALTRNGAEVAGLGSAEVPLSWMVRGADMGTDLNWQNAARSRHSS